MSDGHALLLGALLSVGTMLAGGALARAEAAERARVWAQAIEEGRTC